MKKKCLFLTAFAAIAILFAACTSTHTYDKNGVAFSYPGGWSITADDFGNSLGYVKLEKGATTATIGWLKTGSDIGAEMMLQNALADIQTQGAFSDFTAEPVEKVSYGTYPAIAATYNGTAGGAPRTGTIWVFKAEGYVVNVDVEGSAAARVADEREFKVIEESFILK
ncbi:MAG: hypothetical protein LBV38_03080 [Alistipes sp.]|jgi:hypothetical protein|nr:hypothetical protein [Alistipes sp.]